MKRFGRLGNPEKWVYSPALHPGEWFKDVFSSLNYFEKIVWLDLLALAIASEPWRRANYSSTEQIASLFDTNERTVINVLNKAQESGRIRIRDWALLPLLTSPLIAKEEEPTNLGPEAMIKLGFVDPDKKGFRYKSMAFPGFYTHQWGSQNDHPCSEAHKPSGCTDNDLLDCELIEPSRLLQKRMADLSNGLCRPSVTPGTSLWSWTKDDLPKDVDYFAEPLAGGGISFWNFRDDGFHLWGSDGVDQSWIPTKMWVARVKLAVRFYEIQMKNSSPTVAS